jgi:type II secretory pathway pseudopilin PulG
VFLDLLIVLIILGFLAAYIAPRYAHLDFSTHARTQTARTAVTEGYARLHLATIKYLVENGDMPEDLAGLSPDYLNATESLGDYTAVYVQGTGEITIEVYRGPATGLDSGPPAAARSYPWP